MSQDREVERRHEEQALTAPADGADRGFGVTRRADRQLAEIPVPAVAPRALDGDGGRRRSLQPIRRDDLLALPGAVGQHHLADAQQVGRPHAPARSGARLALGDRSTIRRARARADRTARAAHSPSASPRYPWRSGGRAAPWRPRNRSISRPARRRSEGTGCSDSGRAPPPSRSRCCVDRCRDG